MQPGMCEYLVNHGKSGAIGRFVAATPLTLVRGDRVVVRSQRGLEIGRLDVPGECATARLLGSVLVGELLRPANGDDLTALELLRPLTEKLFDDSRQLIRDLALPAEIIAWRCCSMAVGRSATPASGGVCLGRGGRRLRVRHGVDVLLENLALPAEPEEVAESGGCGKPDCGRVEGGAGGCSTCSSGGGCSSCGSGGVDLAAYFGQFSKMEQHQRIPLVTSANAKPQAADLFCLAACGLRIEPYSDLGFLLNTRVVVVWSALMSSSN